MSIKDTIIQQLFKPLNPARIKQERGVNGSFIDGWDVIAHLSRIFGPLNWDKEVVDVHCVLDEPVDWTTRDGHAKSGFDVAYVATVKLTVRVVNDPYDTYTQKVSVDVGAGNATHQPNRGDAHDLAIKSAVTDGLKRAAKDLGNQFGLSLYNKGSADSVLGRSLSHPELDPQPEPEGAE